MSALRMSFRHFLHVPRARASLGLALAAATALSTLPGAAEAANGSAQRIITNRTGAYLAARSATAQRDIGAAADFYDMVLQGDPNNAGLMERTFLLYLSEGETATALPLAEDLLQLDPSNEMARLTLAVRAFRAGKYNDVRAALRDMRATPLAELTSGLMLGWADQGEGKTDEALKTIAALQGPGFYEVFKAYHSGLIAEAAGRYPEALTFFQTAYAGDPSLRPTEGLARAMARTGDKDGAVKLLNDYLGTTPGQVTAQALLAEIEAGKEPTGGVKEAKEGAAEVLYGIATALTGDSAGADISSIYLQLALYADPNEALGLVALGQLFQSMQRNDAAIALFDRVPADSPLKMASTVQAAISLGMLERYDEAAAKLKPLVEADPSNMLAVLTLGNIYRNQEKFAEAAEAYSKGIATLKEPTRNDWTIFYFRGISYERTKRWPEAEADFQEALKLYPNQPQVLNYLGYSWVDQGMNYDAALKMIEMAVEQRPDDGYIIDSLGWAHYRLGQYDKAVPELERAVELMPQDPVINDHLGDAYWQVGRKLEALYQWRHAKDLDPTPEDLTRIVQKIETGLKPDDTGKDG